MIINCYDNDDNLPSQVIEIIIMIIDCYDNDDNLPSQVRGDI